METITKYLVVICLLFASNFVAADLKSANYEVFIGQFNSDGLTDILLRPKGPLVLILLDDISVPVFAKTTFKTTVIASFPSGQYAIDTSAQAGAINQTQWTAGNYEVVSGDFNGDGNSELFLVPKTVGGTSFVLSSSPNGSMPVIKQQLNPGSFGLDFGAPNTSIRIEDNNNDGRGDIIVSKGNMILAILLANSDGTFSPIGNKKQDSDATISLIWSSFGRLLDNGEMNKAMEYFSLPRQADYERIFTVLGDGIRNMTRNWSQAIPLIVEKDYAEYAVRQTVNGKTRLHIIGFIRDSNGQWLIDQL